MYYPIIALVVLALAIAVFFVAYNGNNKEVETTDTKKQVYIPYYFPQRYPWWISGYNYPRTFVTYGDYHRRPHHSRRHPRRR